jgi:hypothetical protein
MTMPIYSHQTHTFPGAVPFPHAPCFGEDGRGDCIGDCVAVDTDTGVCWYYKLNRWGGKIKAQNPDGSMGFKLVGVARPTPIRFSSIQTGRPPSVALPNRHLKPVR